MSKAITEALNLEPYTPPVATDLVTIPENKSLSDDADFARTNLRELVEISKEALKEALVVAINSESPRAYEVIANMISTSADLNTRLLDTHAAEKKAQSGGKEIVNAVQNNTTNNIVFRGTPAELANLLKNGTPNETQ